LLVEHLENRLLLDNGFPAFAKLFAPDTIGPGSVSSLIFTIDNSDYVDPVRDLSFTDTLPAGVTIATPAMASTDCADGTLSAPDGGSTISLSGARLGAFQSCAVTVDVTSSVPGVHTNVSGDLTSSAGNSGTATDDLTVATTLPGFSKSFSPSSTPLGGRSTLTFTIDNTANQAAVGSLDFTDNLPTGLVVADPAHASTDCTSAGLPDTTLTAAPGTGVITLDANGSAITGFEVLPAGATCTVTVDVTATGAGMLDNVSGSLLADFVSSGRASATLDVERYDLSLIKSFTDDPIPPGETATLEFTITNFDRSSSATDISFTDDLDATLTGLVAAGLPAADVCGAGSTLSGTEVLSLTGGNLGPGGSCTFSVPLQVPPGVAAGAYPNTTSTITGDVGGAPVEGNAASDVLFLQPVPLLTKEFLDAVEMTSDPVINAGDDVLMRFTIDNTSPTSDASDIEFIDELTTFLPSPVTATLPDTPCGGDSALALVDLGFGGQGLSLTGGYLIPGDSCTFDVTLTTPDDLGPGVYTNTTEEITALVDNMTVTGPPATDDFTVIAAPTLIKSFIDDPVAPGGTATLEFTLEYPSEATGDATGISFTDDLAGVLAGLTANLPATPNPPCGAGSSLTGSAGDTLLAFQNGTLTPGQSCTFNVTVDVPAGAAAGSYPNTTSGVSATVEGQAATSSQATDDLDVAGLTFTKEFIDDPVIAGDTITLRFSIENVHPTDDATITFFTDNLAADLPGLAATGPPSLDTCGGTLSGTTSLIYTGGSVMSGQSCTIDIELLVPAAAADGTYSNVTSSLAADQGGTVVIDPATDVLTVNSNLLQLTKEFTDDPVAPGDTTNLTFTITNLDTGQAASDIAFTDDLDSVLSGLVATGLPKAACGGTVDAASGIIGFSGGSLGPEGQCQFDVGVQVPTGAAAGIYPNTTSGVTGLVGEFPVSGDAASDDLVVVEFLDFSKSFDGPTTAAGTPVLTFTITNPNADAVADLSFSDNLDDVLTGLVATNLPQANVCGEGSMLSGTSSLSLTRGNLPANGGTCSFNVDVLVPGTATAGTFPNVTSDLFQAGVPVSEPATADLAVEPPPLFDKSFAPNVISVSDASTLTFTIDNSASALAASSLDFTDNLPAGVIVADPPNATTACTGGTLTAAAGTGLITYAGGTVSAGASCTVQVDVGSSVPGNHVNTTGDLTSSSGNSGAASDTLTVVGPTDFTKLFLPATIGPGSVSELTFTIDNSENDEPVTDLDFTDTLPAGVTIASPANAMSTCGGILSAPDGGGAISFNDGDVGAESACTITVNVTSGIQGTHTNVTGDLISSAGNLGSASADLTVDASLPGFTKTFSPGSISRGGRSTLTFTIDNTANPTAAFHLDFTDNLPPGIVVADPPNAQADCTGGVLDATAGSNVITYGPAIFGDASVAAESSCTVSVDVIGIGAGLLGNTTGELTSGSPAVSSGKASDTLEVTVDPISLIKSFTDDPVAPGGTVTAEFTITNFDRSSGATDIAFTDNLDATLSGLVATGLPAADICGAGSVLSGTSVLTFSGGNLPAGGSCTFSAPLQVPVGASPGIYPNTTSEITADAGGMTVTGGPATDDLFVRTAPGLVKYFIDDAVGAGGTTDLQFIIRNTSTNSDATDIAFTDDLDWVLSGLVAIGLPAADICGAGSTLTGDSVLTFSGGNLPPGGECTFPVNLDVPVGAPGGEFVNTTSEITAIVDDETLTGDAASDSLIVVSAPRLTKSFTNDPVAPGDIATLEFTLTYGEEAAADATGITFTDNLDDVVSGLVATGLPAADVCGAGSVLSGTSSLTLANGSLAPGESCTFNVPLQVPETALPGNHANTTSNVTATIAGLTATGLPADDDLIVSPVTFTKSFIDDPAIPGGTVTLQFSLDNASQTSDVWDIEFEDDLDATLAGLVASGLPMADFCGEGSLIAGTSSLVFTGGNLGPEESCTFDITLDVPVGAASGTYVNATHNGIATVGGTTVGLEPATDALTVSVDQLLLTKSFTDDPVGPGSEVTLEFELTNLNESQTATGISFTDDLDTALSGLVASGLPAFDVCGPGSTLSGTSVLTLSGGNLGPDGSCTFSTTLEVPTTVEPGIATNWTSQVTGTMGGLEVTGEPARDDLQIVLVEFTKTFDDETSPGGTPTLTFTIENLDANTGVSDIEFYDDLDSVLSGLVATGLPAADVCGAGSVLSGTSFLTLTGGNLGTEGSCTFNVPLEVPVTASRGDYINTTSDLFADGVPVGVPASDTLVVTGLGLTGGPLTPGPNPFPVAGATPDGIVILVQGTQPGNAVLTVQGVQITTAFADPVVIAFAEVDANGIGTPVADIPASQIGQTLTFQAFQILPTVLQSGVLSLVVTAGPMLAENGEGPGAAPVAADVLPPLIDEAIRRWELTSLTADQSDLIRAADFQVVDLPDGLLGDTFEGIVSIDLTAAGYGWFVDSTPGDDSEFHYFIGGDEIRAIGGVAAAQMDLLTVVMHELGHILGLADLSNSVAPYDLMTGTLATSARRLPDGSNPSWHNPARPENVNNDQGVTPLDVLVLIDDINSRGVRGLPPSPEGTRLSPPYLDVSGDNAITAFDVLEVITFLQRQDPVYEGESPSRDGMPETPALEFVPEPAFVPPLDSPTARVGRLETNRSTQDSGPQRNATDQAELDTDYATRQRGQISEESGGDAGPEYWLDDESGLTEAITEIAEDVLSVWQSN